jgi:predicted nucleic acid-binding Zn ribbon protein
MNQNGKTLMAHRMNQIEPNHPITKKECQEMIDAAIRQHNRNASIISMCVGWVVLALFAEGLLRLIGVIPPLLPWLNITLK